MNTYAVYLRPRGALHSQVHSGTLFGAICWAIRILGLADLPALLEGFNADPPFILSSPFPYLRGQGKQVRFYPLPCLPELTSAQVRRLAREQADERGLDPKQALWSVIEQTKRLKKVTHVSESLFREMITGQTNPESLWRRWRMSDAQPADIEHIDGMLLTTGERESLGIVERPRSFIKDKDVQRNQIDRLAGSTGEGLLFFERQTFLRRGLAGLWFLLRTRDLKMMEAAFRYLADTGIGGRRTSGKGQFDIEIAPSPLSLSEADDPNAFVVLSLYLPADGDWDQDDDNAPLGYQLVNLRGKHESRMPSPLAEGQRTQPIYKELVRPFTPGSVFPLNQPRSWYGQVVKVGRIGEREVWQNGLALPVLARIGGA